MKLKSFITPCIPLLALAHLSAQNLLNETWKFHTGDLPEWAESDFDDQSWSEIKSGTVWELQGVTDYDGFAWYRKHLTIPSSLESETERMGGMLLDLAKVDDTDQTFFNGHLVGETGVMPPHYAGAYDSPRLYHVKPEWIHWDKDNVIAVRVYDDAGGGGIWGGTVSLRLIGQSDLLVFSSDFQNDNHEFKQDQTVEIPIHVENQGNDRIEGNFSIEIRDDMHRKVAKVSMPVVANPRVEWTGRVQLAPLNPGFYYASGSLECGNDHKQVRFAFCVSPEAVKADSTPPADLEAFWKQARGELNQVDPQFNLIRQPQYCTDTKEVFLLEMRSLGNALIRGWFATPVKPGKYPAILHVQGYSTNMIYEWAYQGDDMVVLALNIRGHGNSQDDINPGFPGYLQSGIESPETYIYRGAYMDCIRAVDFLCSRQEVDQNRIAVEGGSQGGALSFATAALDDRIDLCAPSVPFLSDFKVYFDVAVWPGNEFREYAASNPSFGMEGILSTLAYFDISNLAPWIKVPLYMQVGLVDETCPPRINFAAYNRLSVPREYHIFPEAGHSLPSISNTQKFDWIRTRFEQ